jgi:hypothetical protein
MSTTCFTSIFKNMLNSNSKISLLLLLTSMQPCWLKFKVKTGENKKTRQGKRSEDKKSQEYDQP